MAGCGMRLDRKVDQLRAESRKEVWPSAYRYSMPPAGQERQRVRVMQGIKQVRRNVEKRRHFNVFDIRIVTASRYQATRFDVDHASKDVVHHGHCRRRLQPGLDPLSAQRSSNSKQTGNESVIG